MHELNFPHGNYWKPVPGLGKQATSTPQYLTLHEIPGGTQEDSLENLVQDKIKCLAKILEQIEQGIESRKTLSATLLDEIENQYCYVVTQLELLETAGNPQHLHLETKLDALEQEKRQERTMAWRDTENLKKEFRTWFKQYQDIKQRAKLISPDRIPSQDLV